MKSLLPSFILLAAFLTVTPSSAQVPSPPPVAATTLPNGLQVLVIEDHDMPVVQTGVWYRFGSLYEVPGKTGLAHALEHMMFRGSAHISASGLDDIIARMGAQMNAETNYDYTHFYFEMPADKVAVALQVEADRMRSATIAQSEWRIERGAVLAELDGDASSPFFSLLSQVRAAAYPNSPEGQTGLGLRSDVARATAADIKRYYNQWYAPNNATLVVAGDVSRSQVFALARKYFAAIPAKTLPAHHLIHPVPASGKIAESQFPFPFEVLDLAYAVPGDTEPGEPAVSVLSALINNQRAPFYKSLVESSIALGVDANADTQLRGGLLNVFIVLNPGHTAQEAQAVFQNAMDQSLAHGIDPDLVAAAKRQTIAERVLTSDSLSGLAFLTGYTYGIVREQVQDEDARLAALTPEGVLAAARTYLAHPNVIGHLRPNASPPRGSSQKATASATDDFSKRVPNGKIVEPADIAREIRIPTHAQSKLNPLTFTLPNGLTVSIQRRADRPTVAIRGLIASSSAFEPSGKAGIARLASDVANFGSARFPYAQQRKAIDDLGAQMSFGETFGAHALARDLPTVLALLADAEMHPTFAEPYFTQERDQMANSISQENSISGRAVDRAYEQLLLSPDDPGLRFPSSDTIRAINRNDVIAYAQHYWRPDLTHIAIVGDVSPQEVRNAVEATFGTWQNVGPTPSAHEQNLPAPRAANAWVGTDANDVYIKLGAPALARGNADYDALALINEILAGSGAFESRLLSEMRQKRGLVYSVSGRLEAEPDRGDLMITLSTSPDKVVEAVRFVRSQLTRLQNERVSVTELQEAKARLVADSLMAQDSAQGQADELLNLTRNNLPLDYYSTLSARYARIDAADLQRVARAYLHPDALVEVFAGPRGPWSDGSPL